METAASLPRRRGATAFILVIIWMQMTTLVRYSMLGRLLGPTQLGLAATVVITASFFDLITETGGDRFLVQDKEGDAPEVQRLVQSVMLVRGLGIAAALVLLSSPIAAFYKAPPLAPALMFLAISPLIMAFFHLDMRRDQRHNDFRAQSIGTFTAETASVMATLIAAFMLRNFTAIIYGLITRSLVMVLISHLRAKRPYGLGYSRAHSRAFARFALPLMLNGLLLYFAGQGDRVLVGNRVGFSALGQYSAILLLIYYPSQVLGNYIYVTGLPLVARAQNDPEASRRREDILGGQTLLLALGMLIGFAVVAPWAVPLLYGPRFSQTLLIVVLIAILQMSRFMITAPTTQALGIGKSWIVLTMNSLRLVAVPGAILGGWLIGGLPGVVIGFTAGELAALVGAAILLNRAMGRRPFDKFGRFLAFVVASATLILWAYALRSPHLIALAALALASATQAALIIRREATTIEDGVSQVRDWISSNRYILRRRDRRALAETAIEGMADGRLTPSRTPPD